MKAKINIEKLQKYVNDHNEIVCVISFLSTLLFAVFNRVIGAVQGSIWHESISIYYFALASIKAFLTFYPTKSKRENRVEIVNKTIKGCLIALNLLLIVPIVLLLLHRRAVSISMWPSIGIAFYVTVKTTVTIIRFVKRKNNESVVVRARSTIELMDVVVSILTLQNTLIAVNGGETDMGLYYFTIIASAVGFCINILWTVMFWSKKQNVTEKPSNPQN